MDLKKNLVCLTFFFILMAALNANSGAALPVYNTSGGVVEGKLNVHLVPHTHDDVGWLKTIDQYYVGSNNSIQGAAVQYILDSVLSALQEDENRKFIYVEQAFFQRWWSELSDEKQAQVKKLVYSGQLDFVNGGMRMHGEAVVHYIDMIDQTTIGHRFIKNEFGKTSRIGWQIDPFRHSAVQAYLLGTELGFDSLFLGRIDYQDRNKRKDQKALEVVWQGSKTFGASSQIFTGIFPVNYDPPDGFSFEVNDETTIPVQDDTLLFDYNVKERVDDFVNAAIMQANITRTNHIMWTMGTDFTYQYANSWFSQMDKLIHYVNKINLGIYTTDNKSELSVLVDRPVGGSSIEDGQLEWMLHRRCLYDDSRGVGEALDETVCIQDNCTGLTIQGKYYFSIHPISSGAKWRRTFGQEIYSPLLLAFTHEKEDDWKTSHISKFSATDPTYSLPNNVAITTLEELKDGSVLLRLAHLYEAGEDMNYSKLAAVDLKKVFPERMISEVTDMNL